MVSAGATHSIMLSSKHTSTGSFAMFSHHLPKIDQTVGRNLFVIAGALVMACQLLVMVVVADGQVKKAESRELQMQSQRQVVAQCLERARGAELSTCTTPAYSDNRQATTMSLLDDSTQNRSQSAPSSTIDGLMSMPVAAR